MRRILRLIQNRIVSAEIYCVLALSLVLAIPPAQVPMSAAEPCDRTAEQSIRQKIAVYPKNPETHPNQMDLNGDLAALYYQLGDVFACRQQTTQAIATYRLAISIDPMYPGPVASVKDATRNTQERNARDAFAYNYLANALKRTQNLQAAVPAFRQIIALDPEYAQVRDVYFQLGTALIEQNKLDEAIALYRQQVKRFPSGDAYFDLAYALKLKGQTTESNGLQKKAIAINPKYKDWTYREAKVYQEQGNAFQAKDQLPEAIAAYRKATELNPHQYELFEKLGRLLWQNQQYQETLAVYTQGLELNPTHPYAKQNLQEVKAQLQKSPQPSPASSP
jgi:tetratricopeptide (TPR) repeat protein